MGVHYFDVLVAWLGPVVLGWVTGCMWIGIRLAKWVQLGLEDRWMSGE